MNLLGDHIHVLVAKAPGHHGDEQGEEGTTNPGSGSATLESRIRDTGDTS
jgi:hypothetical protein